MRFEELDISDAFFWRRTKSDQKPVSFHLYSLFTACLPISRTLKLTILLTVWYDRNNYEFFIWRYYLKCVKIGGASKKRYFDFSTFGSVTLTLPPPPNSITLNQLEPFRSCWDISFVFFGHGARLDMWFQKRLQINSYSECWKWQKRFLYVFRLNSSKCMCSMSLGRKTTFLTWSIRLSKFPLWFPQQRFKLSHEVYHYHTKQSFFIFTSSFLWITSQWV